MGTIPLVSTHTFPSAVLTAIALGVFLFAFLGFRKTRHHGYKWGPNTNDCCAGCDCSIELSWPKSGYGRLEKVPFDDIVVSDDPETDDRRTVHEIVGSYGLLAGLEIDQTLMTHDFLNRLIVAGAYRWGLVIKLTKMATAAARDAGATHLKLDHFIKVWVNKTKVTEVATPFLHSGFETMYRREHPFVAAFAD